MLKHSKQLFLTIKFSCLTTVGQTEKQGKLC